MMQQETIVIIFHGHFKSKVSFYENKKGLYYAI